MKKRNEVWKWNDVVRRSFYGVLKWNTKRMPRWSLEGSDVNSHISRLHVNG